MNLLKLTLGVALPCVFHVSAPAQWRDSKHITTTVDTTLSDVRAHPEAFRNVKLRFDVQFASLGNVANPFFTPFVPSEYANFHAWGAEQPIWRKGDFDDMFGLLFLAKNSDQLQELYDTKVFARVRATALVRNTFQGKPWIEVLSFEALPASVDWPTLGHLYRAEDWMAKRQWRRALAEFSLAGQANNPENVVLQIAKASGTCFLRLGEAGPALENLNRAKALTGKTTDVELEALLLAAAKDPSRELDRSVASDGLTEHERPLWEAFEDSAAGALPPEKTLAPTPGQAQPPVEPQPKPQK